MGRRLAPHEILEVGDHLYYNGVFWMEVDGLRGELAGDYTNARRGSFCIRPGEDGGCQPVIDFVMIGLDKIIEGLWKSD